MTRKSLLSVWKDACSPTTNGCITFVRMSRSARMYAMLFFLRRSAFEMTFMA